MGNLLIPIIILLIAGIVSVLVIMVSGKNKTNNKRVLVENKSNIDLMKSEPLPDLSVNDNILPNVPMNNTVSQSNSVLPQVEVVPKEVTTLIEDWNNRTDEYVEALII